MAVLESIRSKAGTIVLIVIGLALFSFVMQDLFSSGNSMFRSNSMSVGEINGTSVSGEEFSRRLSAAEENLKRNQNMTGIDDNTRQQLVNQIWNEYLDELLYNQQMDEAGIEVSDDELFDMIQGDNVDPSVSGIPAFQDSITRQFDRNLVIQFINKQLTEENDPDGVYRKSWSEFEQSLMKSRRKAKYNTAIKKAIYVTNAQAKADYINKNQISVVRFAAKRYDTVADSTITVSDDDLKKYYNENSFEFEQRDETRKIEYVVFQVNASAEDRQEIVGKMEALRGEFETTPNDTAFVSANSEAPYNVRSEKRGGINPAIEEAVFTAAPGAVFGPYIDGNEVRLAKLLSFSAASDSVKARHILISTRETPVDVAIARADSIKNAVKAGSDFAELAKKFSDDPGSGAQGGDLGWFTEGQMVPEFNDACFNGKVGDMVVVTTTYGAHLINIQEKTRPTNKAKVVYIQKAIVPSRETNDDYYNKANDFAVNAQTYDAFIAEAKKRDLYVVNFENLRPSDRQVNDIQNSRELVQWAYNEQTELNNVSKVFDLDGKYVVATLTGIKDKGIPPFDQLKDVLKPLAIREKKAETFKAEFEKAMPGASTIEDLASKMGLTVGTSSYSFGSFSIPSLGVEPKVIGTTYTLKDNTMSKPIAGKQAVIVVFVETLGGTVTVPEDLSTEKNNTANSFRNRAESSVNGALLKVGKVEDLRYKFF